MSLISNITEKWNKALEDTWHTSEAVKKQAELWNKAAARYDKSMGKDYNRLNACMRALEARNMIDRSVYAADIGCGTGELSLMLSPYVKWVDAIDGSHAMINVMKSKINENTSNVTLVKKDFNAITETKYDVVIASYNPATYAPDAFGKYLTMGTGGLFSVSSAKSENKMIDRLKLELFGKQQESRSGMRVEYPYEYLKASGINTELSFSKSSCTHMQPSKDAISHYKNLFSLMENYPKNGDEIIEKFILKNSENDMFTEEIVFSTGIITWIK